MISHGDLESTEEPDPHACVVSHNPALPNDGSLPPHRRRYAHQWTPAQDSGASGRSMPR